LLVKLDNDVSDQKEVMRQYNVSFLPTLILLNKYGLEIDRIVGYMGPDPLSSSLRELGCNGSFAQKVVQLEDLENPPDDLIEDVLHGLFDREEYEDLILIVDHLQKHNLSSQFLRLRSRSRMLLFANTYESAARQMLDGQFVSVDSIPRVAMAPHLAAIVREYSTNDVSRRDLPLILREARRKDFLPCLEEALDVDDKSPDRLISLARNAFENGCYLESAEIYENAFNETGAEPHPSDLRDAASKLIAAGVDTETALDWAENAASKTGEPIELLVLSKVYYVSGDFNRAHDAAQHAHDVALEKGRTVLAHRILTMRLSMAEGLIDIKEPDFESWPER
jgi:tetratricopeptide (TPR) repeat protein